MGVVAESSPHGCASLRAESDDDDSEVRQEDEAANPDDAADEEARSHSNALTLKTGAPSVTGIVSWARNAAAVAAGRAG